MKIHRAVGMGKTWWIRMVSTALQVSSHYRGAFIASLLSEKKHSLYLKSSPRHFWATSVYSKKRPQIELYALLAQLYEVALLLERALTVLGTGGIF
jgi:hypothetical protein